jgi:molybdopterin-guanine dinucleotide biosynthesis protein MobB
MRLYGVTGWKNAGKTGLMERLVAEITGRGWTVSTVKHAHHSFDVDHPGRTAIATARRAPRRCCWRRATAWRR